MNIQTISPVSFKGYIPVKYMAKDDETGRYMPVTSNEYIKKCQSFVVRNLNGTAKNNVSEEFVELYKSYDKDYAKNPVVRSVYDKNRPIVHMFSGTETDIIDNYAKPVGRAKGEAMDAIGKSKSFESSVASRNFFKNVRSYINGSARRLKSENGKNLSLVVYFNPKYTRNDNLKKFEYAGAVFLEDA